MLYEKSLNRIQPLCERRGYLRGFYIIMKLILDHAVKRACINISFADQHLGIFEERFRLTSNLITGYILDYAYHDRRRTGSEPEIQRGASGGTGSVHPAYFHIESIAELAVDAPFEIDETNAISISEFLAELILHHISSASCL